LCNMDYIISWRNSQDVSTALRFGALDGPLMRAGRVYDALSSRGDFRVASPKAIYALGQELRLVNLITTSPIAAGNILVIILFSK
jgi:hypothetical protein